ncbi:putative rhamnosidase B [Aspergillus candidus]|uniref:Uncharacterized protein n=1 Tax=Aspergillus candidus TaxID=41067 RepID=A0A2I2FLX3_ASPCN|nr:hypothetical protein BDW47DRAFT_122675 [Aspergillus candidus]PLB41638.1 hypothetical protein BDW47DRAFT_122675 [Aspergillus candidus]
MKIIIFLQALLMATYSHTVLASVTDRSMLIKRQDNSTVTPADGDAITAMFENGNIVNSLLENGRQKVEFFGDDGLLEVTAIETDDGAIFYDNEGNEVNLADLDLDDDDDEESDDTEQTLQKRVSKWRIAIRFAKLIAKYGKKVWPYIKCVGTAPFWKCGTKFLHCAERGIAPWSCVEGGWCIGRKTYLHCK